MGRASAGALILLLAARAQAARWVVGVQPAVIPADYRSGEAFQARLSEAVDRALSDRRIAASDQKLVVLPEEVGTWLAVSGERPAVYEAKDRAHAVGQLLLGNPRFAKALLKAALRERRLNVLDSYFVFGTLLRLKAPEMWEAYRRTCSGIAKTRGATLVCGSIVLPKLSALGDPAATLYNVSYIFGPDGVVLHETRKVHPIPEELRFLSPAPASELSVAQTPFGKIGDMICADGWHEDVYDRLHDAQVLVQPSFGEGGLASFARPWGGYATSPTPEAARGAVGKVTEREAWRLFSLAGRMGRTRALAGINVFMSARLWDIDSGGWGVAIAGGRRTELPTAAGRDTFVALRL